jgi:hypothetical protein
MGLTAEGNPGCGRICKPAADQHRRHRAFLMPWRSPCPMHSFPICASPAEGSAARACITFYAPSQRTTVRSKLGHCWRTRAQHPPARSATIAYADQAGRSQGTFVRWLRHRKVEYQPSCRRVAVECYFGLPCVPLGLTAHSSGRGASQWWTGDSSGGQPVDGWCQCPSLTPSTVGWRKFIARNPNGKPGRYAGWFSDMIGHPVRRKNAPAGHGRFVISGSSPKLSTGRDLFRMAS